MCWSSRASIGRSVLTKSGFMVGLGETDEEIRCLLRDLRGRDVDVATIGQYLQPTRRNLDGAGVCDTRAVRPMAGLRVEHWLQDGVQRAAGA